MPKRIPVRPSDHLTPDGFYPLESFLKIARISRTTLYRAEHLEGIELRRVKSGGRVYVEGRDAIDFLRRRAAATAK